jgi:hypothetical protein
VAVSVLWSGVLPAAALHMDEFLERSGDADFYGRQSVACATPDGVRDAVLEVAQARGVLSVRMPMEDAPSVTVSEVGTSIVGADGSVSTRIVGARSGTRSHDYVITTLRSVSYERRTSTEITVQRDGVERARLTFDDESGVLVRSETLNADGSHYCEIALTQFTPRPGVVLTAELPSDPDASTLQSSSRGDDLPHQVAGFDRIDVYELHPGQIVAYYTDGLFSFTLLRSDRPLEVEGLNAYETERGVYRRAFGPNQALYVWSSGDTGYAMLGDQPLDLQEAVLALLPAPLRYGFWERIWRLFFR